MFAGVNIKQDYVDSRFVFSISLTALSWRKDEMHKPLLAGLHQQSVTKKGFIVPIGQTEKKTLCVQDGRLLRLNFFVVFKSTAALCFLFRCAALSYHCSAISSGFLCGYTKRPFC